MDTEDPGEASGMKKYRGAGQPISAREQLELVRRAKAGDRQAFDRLVLCNIPLVIRIASRYRWSGIDMEDLVAEGVLGLYAAVEHFDPDRGASFMSYGGHWVQRAMQQAAQRLMPPVHIAPKVFNKRWPFFRVSFEDRGPDGQKVPLSELLEQGMFAPAIDLVATREGVERVRELLRHLEQRTKYVIVERFGLYGRRPKKLREIAKRLGLSKQMIRLIELKGLRQLRRAAGIKEPEESAA